MTVGEKALTMAYVHSKLLITNLETAVHEMKVSGRDFGQLNDKLQKLRGAARNAFGKLEKNLKEEDDLEGLTEAIDELFNQTWE